MSGKKRRRSPADKEERKQEIKGLTRDTIIKGGYAAVKMRDLAKKLNASPASLYSYFNTKDEIIQAIIEDGLDDLNERINDVTSQKAEFMETVKQICYVYFQFQQESPHLYKILYPIAEEIVIAPETRTKFYQMFNSAIGVALRNAKVNEGLIGGYQDLLSKSLWGSLHGLIVLNRYILKQPSKSFDDEFELIQILLEGWSGRIQFT